MHVLPKAQTNIQRWHEEGSVSNNAIARKALLPTNSVCPRLPLVVLMVGRERLGEE